MFNTYLTRSYTNQIQNTFILHLDFICLKETILFSANNYYKLIELFYSIQMYILYISIQYTTVL